MRERGVLLPGVTGGVAAPAARALRGATMGVLAAIAVCVISGVAAAMLLVSIRASEVQEVRDTFWLALRQVDVLKAELLRAPRGRLDDWLAEAGTRPDRRRPAARLAEAGLVAVLLDGSRARVAGAPDHLPRARLQDRQWLADLSEARDFVPIAGLWCLRLPEADARVASGWVSDLGTSRLMLAACVSSTELQGAADATLPRSTELTFWRDRHGLVRITRLANGKTTVGSGIGTLHRDVLDRGEQAFDLQAPSGAWNLLAHRTQHTVAPLQFIDEDRPTGRHRFMYVSRANSAAGWTGFSLAFHDPAVPPEFDFWWWWGLGLVALAILAFPLCAWGLWRRIGREVATGPPISPDRVAA
jgi:hypothetical protein